MDALWGFWTDLTLGNPWYGLILLLVGVPVLIAEPRIKRSRFYVAPKPRQMGTAIARAILEWEPVGGGATHVYYFYDVQGNLLYVGITNNLRRRWAQHAEDKPWWHLVARKESVTYSTREEAEKVEAHQIRTHRPMFNRAMNGWFA